MNQWSENQSNKIFWWCDTLCVPVGDEYKPARRKAIISMRQIYQKASKVLVLDGDLSTRSGYCSIVEIYIRIVTSTWMRRLWTLQEGYVAEDLYFQFQEGPVSLKKLQASVIEMASSVPDFLYWWYDNDFTEYLGIFTVDYSEHRHLVPTAIFRNVQWRSTSWEGDETICLSNLYGLDITSLLEIPDSEYEARMVWFLENLGHFPPSILFQQDPRLSIEHFRWAPKSLMQAFRDSGMSWLYDRKPDVQVLKNGQGALAILPGVLLETASEIQLAYGIGFTFELGPDLFIFATEFCKPIAPSEERKVNTASHVFKCPAVILYESPSETGVFKECDKGVLVDLQTDGNAAEGQLVASYVALVGLVRSPREIAEALAENLPGFKILKGRALPDDQKWLIL
jgi:hypothetical protein